MPVQTPSQPDGDTLIDTVTTAILARHPSFTRADVWAEVAASYHRLAPDSRIPDHLAVLMEHEATDRLRGIIAEPDETPADAGA